MTERMSPGVAVFNLHVSDAGVKAKAIFIATFGQDKWDQKIQPLEDAGIMCIFDGELTFWEGFYVALVTALVNGDVVTPQDDAIVLTYDERNLLLWLNGRDVNRTFPDHRLDSIAEKIGK